MSKAQSRMTKQRKVILEELSKVCTHPTAEEVYHMVRQRLPHISLGTVYRNLDLLAESHQILKLESGTTRRFDANTCDHAHVRCVACDSVDDVFETKANESLMSTPLKNGYTVLGVRVEYDGLCPKCQEAQNKNVLTA